MNLLTEAIWNSCDFNLKKNNHPPFLSLKPINGASDFILKKTHKNIFTSLMPLGTNWVSKEAENLKELIFLGFVVLFFSQNCTISEKPPKNGALFKVLIPFWMFLKIFHVWLENSAPNQRIWVPWSFPLLLTPSLPLMVQDEWSEMIPEANTSMWASNM